MRKQTRSTYFELSKAGGIKMDCLQEIMTYDLSPDGWVRMYQMKEVRGTGGKAHICKAYLISSGLRSISGRLKYQVGRSGVGWDEAKKRCRSWVIQDLVKHFNFILGELRNYWIFYPGLYCFKKMLLAAVWKWVSRSKIKICQEDRVTAGKRWFGPKFLWEIGIEVSTRKRDI